MTEQNLKVAPASPESSNTVRMIDSKKMPKKLKTKKTPKVYPTDPKIGEFFIFLICGLIQNIIGGGILYSVGLYIKVWMKSFNVGSGTASWLGTMTTGTLCILGPLASYLVSKFGTRSVVFVGAVVAAISITASSLVDNVYVLMLTYGIGTGAGLGMSYTPVMVFLTQVFGKYRGVGNGFVTAGSSLGNFVVPFMVSWSLDEFGWRGSILLLGGMTFNLMIGSLLARRWTSPIPPQYVQSPLITITDVEGGEISNNEKPPPEDMDDMIIRSLTHITVFKQTKFVYLAIHSFLLYIGVSIIYVHIVPCSEEMFNLDTHKARFTISLLGLTNLFGRVITGVALQHPKVDCFSIYISFNFIFGICVGFYPFCAGYSHVLIMVSIMGFLLAAYGSLTNIVLADLLPEKYLLSALGYTYCSGGVGSVIGAPLAGWLYDATGNYANSMYLGSACTFISILIIVPSWLTHVRQKCRRDAEPVTNKHVAPELENWIASHSNLPQL
ncbi:monocarboxylate transporter 14-like [Tubulanus polymorphus]|uniref:monocarboxylate transporter 14-like n=1 Tax=Tubulanus polymorphus TaxID=672921 RepID=UPI003DA438C3